MINKTVTNDEILDGAELIFASGIENLKLYYMIGLPTETDDDLVAIRDLTVADARAHAAARAAAGRIGRIVGSVNPLIPKPGTAYQWLPMEDPARDRPQGASGCASCWPASTTSTSTSSRSGIRTTRRSCRSATGAWRRPSRRRSATAATGARRSPRAASTRTSTSSATARSDAVLPWDIIDGGMKTSFFQSEFEKACSEEWTLPPKRQKENSQFLPVLQ